MEITVVGRHAEISSRFRAYAEEKVSKVTQYDPRAQRVEIEVSHERNPRLADTSERVELTVISKGPVIRAEASSSDRYAAFDLAIDKLFERLRRARDRKKDHRRYPMITAEVEQALVEQGIEVAPEAEAEIQAALTRLVRGKTVLVIAHRAASIIGVDQVAILEAGRLIARGTPDELADHPYMRELSATVKGH